MEFNKLVNSIIKEMADQSEEIMDIGPDEDPGADGFTKEERLKSEIEWFEDQLGYPTSNLQGMSLDEIEDMHARLSKDFEIKRNHYGY